MPSSAYEGVENRVQKLYSLQSGRNSLVQFSFYDNKRKKKERREEGEGRSAKTRIDPPTKEGERKLSSLRAPSHAEAEEKFCSGLFLTNHKHSEIWRKRRH
jgi:hypothetical protein